MTCRIYVRLICLLKNVMSILRQALDGMSGLSDTCQLSLSKSVMSILRQALDGMSGLSDTCQLSCLLKNDMSILRQALDDLSDLCQAELVEASGDSAIFLAENPADFLSPFPSRQSDAADSSVSPPC